jgi:hypothetical protein
MHESPNSDGEAWAILIEESTAEWGNCDGSATRFAHCEG